MNDQNSGKVAPCDLTAEASVLSAVMLEPKVLDEIGDGLSAEDFYSEPHRRIYEAAVYLKHENMAIDMVSVASRLKTTDRLAQVGGLKYLADILDACPVIRHAKEHAKVVRKHARMRGLIVACQRAAAKAYQGGGMEVLEELNEQMDALSDLGDRSRMHHIRDFTAEAVKELMAAKGTGGVTGTCTGLIELDRTLTGFHAGELIVIAGRPAMGKAHPMETRVLTPTGWRPIGDLKPNDKVIGSDGKPCRVLAVHDRGALPVYDVQFEDGGHVECCDDHLWVTRTRKERLRNLSGTVRSLRDIRNSIRVGSDSRLNHSIQYVRPVDFGRHKLPLHPYVMGVFLGDGDFSQKGTVRITKPDKWLIARVDTLLPDSDMLSSSDGMHHRVKRKKKNNKRSDTAEILARAGLEGRDSLTKFIPQEYLLASIEDRIELLRGLLDTDGYVYGEAGIEISTSSELMRDGISFLAQSLGGRVNYKTHVPTFTQNGERRNGAPAHRMRLSFPAGDFVPVSTPKKVAKYRVGSRRIQERFLTNVEYVGIKTCRCITVDAKDSLYVTEDFIVTHNSAFAFGIGGFIANMNQAVAAFSLEMPGSQVALRSMCSVSGVSLHRARGGRLGQDELTRVLGGGVEGSKVAHYWIDETPGCTIDHIRSHARKIQRDAARTGVPMGAVIVDYLQLVRESRSDSREQQVAEVSRSMKELAKEFNCPVLALSQLNRKVEERSDKRPMLSDLRDSGAIEQDADVVLFLYRDEVYRESSPDKGICEVIIAKQRNGPLRTVKVVFDGPTTTFRNLHDSIGLGFGAA